MNAQFEQLENEGYTVFPNFLDQPTVQRIREHMDSLMPPIAPPEQAVPARVHLLRHPIPGAIMAEILARPELIELATELLKAKELRLLEQVLIRTDPQITKPPVGGWHVDMAFLPEHYQATPRQTYFHMVHCLNNVAPGGGAFTIVPGSHHKTFAAATRLGSEEALQELRANPIEVAGVDISEAIEVNAKEGDLLVFNPMALHSASANHSTESRYVYFASFHDVSADYLIRELQRTNYSPAFPDSLRDNLPEELRFLLDSPAVPVG
jgi:ectoine hydroxylase-related dioxygenase (phytanoyl-CoA dioxygenase family)